MGEKEQIQNQSWILSMSLRHGECLGGMGVHWVDEYRQGNGKTSLDWLAVQTWRAWKMCFQLSLKELKKKNGAQARKTFFLKSFSSGVSRMECATPSKLTYISCCPVSSLFTKKGCSIFVCLSCLGSTAGTVQGLFLTLCLVATADKLRKDHMQYQESSWD